MIRTVDGVTILVLCLRDAAKRYSAISCAPSCLDSLDPSQSYTWLMRRDMPDKSTSRSRDRAGTSDANTGPSESYDERSAELMDCLAMLYFVVEVSRSDPDFGEELSTWPLILSFAKADGPVAMSPSLPIVLFQMIALLKDRVFKEYPVKKVLLLLWKTLLACLGGIKDVAKARVLSRELAGLPPVDKSECRDHCHFSQW